MMVMVIPRVRRTAVAVRKERTAKRKTTAALRSESGNGGTDGVVVVSSIPTGAVLRRRSRAKEQHHRLVATRIPVPAAASAGAVLMAKSFGREKERVRADRFGQSGWIGAASLSPGVV